MTLFHLHSKRHHIFTLRRLECKLSNAGKVPPGDELHALRTQSFQVWIKKKMQTRMVCVRRGKCRAGWKAETAEFKEKFGREFYRWYYRQAKLKKMLTPFMRYVGEYVS